MVHYHPLFFRRVLALALALGVLAGGAALAPARRPMPTSPEAIAALRTGFQASQREREAAQETQDLVPWVQTADSPGPQFTGNTTGNAAAVHLVSELNFFRAIWTFEPAEGGAAKPVRVPLCWRGEQWITLAPGAWRISLAVGLPGGDKLLRFPAQTVKAGRSRTYEMKIRAEVEPELMAKARAARKTPPEGADKSAKGDEAQTGKAATVGKAGGLLRKLAR